MKCTACHVECVDGAAFCASCGARLFLACAGCGRDCPADARFCPGCGQALRTGREPDGPGRRSSDPPDSVTERRQLTVLFADIADSAALGERLDPEDLRDLLSAFQRTCREAIVRYGGHVAQYLGDGVMAYFGYPRSHEDDAVRAARAARRILDGVSDVNTGIGRRLQSQIKVRIGMHTGLAVVGDVGPGGTHDRLAIGDTVNLAARVQSRAEAGSVVASAAMARLVRGYVELRSLGPASLEGFSTPVELFELLEETGARSRLEAATAAGLTPYVGRERELSALVKAWQEVRLGGQRVVFIRGEAGIGKSRLIDAFRKTALPDSSSVLECFCTQLAQATALAPIIAMLERRLDERTGSSSPAARLAALRSSLAEHSRLGAEALPLFASLLSLPGADEVPLAGMSAALRRTRTLAVLHSWLRFSAERVPTLLLFEDLHWADATTLDFIELLLREGGGSRTLICMTSRPEQERSFAARDVLRLDLRRLSHAETDLLVGRAAGGRALPTEVVFRIIEQSEGVPLFAEEITRGVIESGALINRGDRYEFGGDPDADLVPAALSDTLLARFDRLGSSRPIAQLAAAIGREFSVPVLQSAAGLSEADLRSHLARLCSSGLVFAQGEAPATSYIFKHALVHEAVYGTLLRKNRTEAHAGILSVLKADFPEWLASHPEAGAYHAEEAGLRREAIDYLKTAGMRALARTETAGAARHLTRALGLLDAVDEPERSQLELELVMLASHAYIAVHGYAAPDTIRACVRARELALTHGQVASQLMTTNSLCAVLIVRGELRQARVLARELMEAPAAAANPLLRIMALQVESNTLYYSGHFEQALQASSEGLGIFDREKDSNPAVRYGAPLTALSWVHAAALAMHGRLDEVPASLNVWEDRTRAYRSLGALAGAAEKVNFTTLAIARATTPLFMSIVLYIAGDRERASGLAAEALAIAAAERLTLWYSIAKAFMAYYTGLSHHDPSQAVEELRNAVAAYLATGSRVSFSTLVAMLAELLLAAGKPEDARSALAQELERIEPEHELHFQPELLRLQGKALLALGRSEDAAQSYRDAIAAAHALGAILLSLRAATDLHRLVGDAESRVVLQQEYDRFSEGLSFADLRLARAALEAGLRVPRSA